MKSLILIISIFCIAIISPNKSIGQQRIKVTWDSFLQDKPKDGLYGAQINTSIHNRYRTKPGAGNTILVQFDIKAVVDSTKSYIDINQKYRNHSLLKHEQGHADIAVIYALKLRRELESRKYLKQNFKQVIDDIYADFSFKMYQHQLKYDLETNHGLDKNSQEKWDQYFDETFKTKKF